MTNRKQKDRIFITKILPNFNIVDLVIPDTSFPIQGFLRYLKYGAERCNSTNTQKTYATYSTKLLRKASLLRCQDSRLYFKQALYRDICT